MKNDLYEKICNLLELPMDYALDMPKVVLFANRVAMISNYKGIIEYSDEIIRLKTTNKQIGIVGTDLMITELQDDSITITGRIAKIEYLSKNQLYEYRKKQKK